MSPARQATQIEGDAHQWNLSVTGVRRSGRDACDHPPVPEKELRNPFQSEEDAFRILVMIIAVAVIVIACAVLISTTLGAILGVIAIAVGLWRAGGWLARCSASPTRTSSGGPGA